MTLTLVDAPANGAVDQYPSGLVVLRAEDFVGPARGTLTTTADADSVVGTVVTETQALVVPSTLSGVGTGASSSARWPLASDTLRIPIATLAPYLANEITFDVMVSIKVSGDVPSNARYQKNHAFFDQFHGGAAAGLAWGRDSTFLDGRNIQTNLYDGQFLITAPLTTSWSTISLNTNLVLRVWGVTGGTMSYALDLVYMIGVSNINTRLKHFLAGYPPFHIIADGVVAVDQDNNDTDNVIGKFSVGGINHTPGVMQIGPSAPTDFQEADNEPTAYDINSDDWTGPSPTPLDPKSWMAFIAAPQYIPEIQLVNEPFTAIAPTTNLSVISPEGYIISDALNGIGGPGHSSGFNGWTGNNAGELYCYLASGASQPTGSYGGWPHAELFVGLAEVVSGSTTDPRNYTHTLFGLEDHTSETTFACNLSNGEVTAIIGFQAYAGNDFPPPAQIGLHDDGYGVRLVLTGGTLTASLVAVQSGAIASPTPYNGTIYEFSSPITVDSSYTAGETYRVKVERRRYRLRAKVWEDGTSEPGTWTFDEYMPFRWTSSPSGSTGFLEYPYDTNWASSADHDLVNASIWQLWQQSLITYMAIPHNTAPEQHVIAKDYQVWIEPAGASPIDMLVAEEDWDGANRSNDVTIPFATIPSHRFIEGSLRKRHFLADTRGWNILAWKDGGAGPEMQSSGLPLAWEKARRKRRPQFYRRTYG